MFDSFLNLSTNLGVQFQSPWLLLILLWVLPWKGVALWKASRNSHKKCFIALLLLNTLALLEIIYIFYFSKRSRKIKILTKSGSYFSKPKSSQNL